MNLIIRSLCLLVLLFGTTALAANPVAKPVVAV